MTIKNNKTIDGDTFIGDDKKYYRLAGVNAPEKRQKGYQKAKKELDTLLGTGSLVATEVARDRGRIVVKIRKSGQKTTINEKMKNKGYK